jgi:hypothetical protein
MPFTKERTELIRARIRAKLDSNSSNDWEKSFLENMEVKFLRNGSTTNLSTAQYDKLYKILRLEKPRREPSSTRPTYGSVNLNAAKPWQHRTNSSNSLKCRSKRRARSPIQFVYSPRRAIRRFERKLFLPIALAIGVLVLLGNVLQPTTSTFQEAGPAYAIVSGSSVNQSEGPSTAHG